MKKIIWSSLVILGIVVIGCNKTTTLPDFPTPAKNFTIASFAHQQDTIAAGSALNFNASGTVTDTTKTMSVYMTVTYGSTAINLGSSTSPLKINRVIGAATNGSYAWTASVPTVNTSIIPHGTKVTVTATFSYQLSLSSAQPSPVTFTDQGLRPGSKSNLTTVFVQ